MEAKKRESLVVHVDPCFVFLPDEGTRLAGFERPMYPLLRISVHPSLRGHDRETPCLTMSNPDVVTFFSLAVVWRKQWKRLLYRLLL